MLSIPREALDLDVARRERARLQPSWPAPVKQMSGAETRRPRTASAGSSAGRHGMHLHLRVLGERVADPARAQLGRESVVRLVYDDDVELVARGPAPVR